MALVWGAPVGAFAEGDLAAPGVVVTADRFERQAGETPIGVTVITAEQIRDSGARTLPEVLSREVGFTVRDNSGSPNRQIDLRGFGITGDQNTLVLVNGQRISENELTPADLASISLGTVERIEILRSSGAVLYGGGATGGTVNIITRGPKPEERSAQIAATAGSYDTLGASAGINLATERFGLGLNAARLSSDNYRRNNALTQENVAGELTWFGDRGPVSLKFSKGSQELGLPGARTEAQLTSDRRGATNPNDYASLDDTRVTLGTTQRAGSVELAVDVTHRERKSRTFQFGGNNDINGRVTGVSPRVRIPFDIGYAQNSLVLGADWDRWNFNNTISSFGYFGTSEQENAALYFQDTLEFPTRTIVSVGARTQRVDTTLTETQTSQQVRTVNATELALRQALGEDWSVHGKIGRSFRLPVVDEIRSFGFSLPNLLEPQTSRDAEIGVQFAQPERRARLAVFQSRLENEIMFVPFAPGAFFSGTNVNLPPTRRTGLEVDGSTLLGQHWEASVRYAYTEAEFRSGTYSGIDITGNEIPLVPRHKAGATLAWRPSEVWLFNAIVTFVGEQRYDNDQANTFDRKMPSYTLLDLNAAWTHGPLTLRASVLNATNVMYYSYARAQIPPGTTFTAYPAADRTLLFTAELRFGNR